MQKDLFEFLEFLGRWHAHPTRMNRLVLKNPVRDVTIPPQITWTLLTLIHYRDRKRNAWKMLRNRLPAQVAAERGDKMVTIDEVMQGGSSGIVPGRPEWSYELDGNASFVTNRVTGEHIHVDILNGPDAMNPHYFSDYLVRFHKPNSTVRRLLELFPHGRGLVSAIEQLRTDGVFHVIDECDGDLVDFELCGVVNPFVESVNAFLSAWTDAKNRSTLGSVIGDWKAVKDATEETGSIPDEEVTSKAKLSRQRWLTLLRFEAGDVLTGDLLYALAAAGAEDLPEYLRRALEDPEVAVEAVEIISEEIGDDAAWRAQVEVLFDRGVRDKFFSHARGAAANYLARVGADIEPLLEGLLTTPKKLKDATVLALKYARHHVLRLLRHALRSRCSDDRLTAAAVLALIDSQQSRQELFAVLNGSSDLDATVECRAALFESSETDAHVIVEAWEVEHPEPERIPVISDRFAYRFDGGCDRALRQRMFQLADRVNSVDHKRLFTHSSK